MNNVLFFIICALFYLVGKVFISKCLPSLRTIGKNELLYLQVVWVVGYIISYFLVGAIIMWFQYDEIVWTYGGWQFWVSTVVVGLALSVYLFLSALRKYSQK